MFTVAYIREASLVVGAKLQEGGAADIAGNETAYSFRDVACNLDMV